MIDGCEGRINPAARSISFGDLGGAFLITGTDKVRSGYGNGDCVLMDFCHSVFALSDSTERYSSASRNLLERLYRRLAEEGVPDSVDDWKSMADRLFSSQDYRQKATFSCVAFSERGDSVEVTVLNGGDSAIFLLNTRKERFEYMSRPDMYFAGRSNEISHVSRLALDGKEYRVMLCTDGLSDIAKIAGKTLPEMFVDCLMDDFPDISGKITAIAGSSEAEAGAEYDDTGFLVLDPLLCLERSGRAVIMGGTNPVEETEYQRRHRISDEYDCWMEVDKFSGDEEALNLCGIKFL